jgi:MFS family permease
LKKIEYKWVMCIVGALILFCTMGMTIGGFTVYQSYLVSLGGLSNSQASLLITIRSLFSLVAMLVVTVFYGHLHLRAGLTISVLAIAVAFALYGLANGFWAYAAASAFAGLGYGLGGMVAISILITQWFSRYRALALGICTAATGAATIVISPLATFLVQTTSLSFAFFCEAVFCAVIAVITALLIRSKPHSAKEQADENEVAIEHSFADLDALELDAAAAEEAAVEAAEERARALRAKRAKGGANEPVAERHLPADHPSPNNPTPFKYLVPAFIAMLLWGSLGNTAYAHLGILFSSEGLPANSVAILLMVCGLALVVGKLIYGHTVDKLGGFFSNFIFFVLIFVGYLACCFASSIGFIGNVAAMVICGLGLPLATVGTSVFAADLSSQTSYVRVLQIFQVLYAVSSMLFGFLPGTIADATGSYVPFYALSAVLTVVCAVLIQSNYLIRLRNRKKRARSFIAAKRKV